MTEDQTAQQNPSHFASRLTMAHLVSENENLRRKLETQPVIEQAKGILMERRKFTEDQAFTALSRASQDTNIKLRDVADQLVRTGALPERPPAVR